jgi:hypothetical protein
MKLLFALFLILVSGPNFKQLDKVLSYPFDDIQYVEDLHVYDEDIYCAGYTFKTSKNDGNSCDAYLVNYQKNNLEKKWSIKIDDLYSNKINSVLRHENKIYMLVTQGTVKSYTQDVTLKLYILDLFGEVEDIVNFDSSFNSPSNLTLEGNELYFGYQVGTSTTYSGNKLRSVIVIYNLRTKKLKRFESSQYQSRPKKLVRNGKDAYLYGIYIHKNVPDIMAYRNGKYYEVSLNPLKEEYFMDAYIKNNILTTVVVFPGVYGDLGKYLKFYYLNLDNNQITSLKITYKDLGWSDERFDVYSTGFSSWLIVEDEKTKTLNHVLIDSKGNVKQSFRYDKSYKNNGYWQRYTIENKTLYNASQGRIRKQKF